ncbi:nose resistant to fluoxetine protein 6-like [Oppia nitens]|uniref:nose resistant to fluoxetine protein 6-like n=1 Tax=Oppia nitens TaxID=1686743 RepID=UPI0023DB05DA|nr:nose resistant to fluoxetine protein 6-like [Oppia nitens]
MTFNKSLCIASIVDNHNHNEYKLWEKFYNYSKVWSKDYVKTHQNKWQTLAKEANVSVDCRKAINSVFDGIGRLDDWAVQMINSWAKFPPNGAFDGTFTDLGAYDQCLAIDGNKLIGKGQYCLLDLSLPLPQPMPIHHNLFHPIDVLLNELINNTNNALVKISKNASILYWLALRVGICTPNKCTLSDIKLLTKRESSLMGLNVRKIRCEIKTEIKFNSTQLVALFTIFTFILCSTIASICGFLHIYYNKTWFRNFVKIFSLKINFDKLITVKTSQELSCIHGIRFFTLIWIIYGHTVLWNDFNLFGRTLNIKQHLTNPILQPIFNAGNSVDTFFLISGILTSYITYKLTNGDSTKFNGFAYFITRYLRLTPQMAIFMLISFLIPLIGSGPIWHEFIDPVMDKCYNNFWQNFIFLQNIIDVENMCLLHTWYLAVDMQMHWMSFIIIVVMLRSVRLGLWLSILAIIGFYTSTAIVTFINDFPPVYTNTGRTEFYVNVFTNVLYFRPTPHGISFFVGFVLGYYIYTNRFVKLSKMSSFIAWIAVIIGFEITLSDTIFYNYGQPFNKYISAVVFPSSRLLYAVCLAATIWLCITGNGGFINKFLSCKILVPFARLTYCTFLVHAWSIYAFIGTRRYLIDTTMYSTLTIFLQHICVSYTLGLVFSLLFEYPVINLLNIWLKYIKDKRNEKYASIEMRTDNNMNL